MFQTQKKHPTHTPPALFLLGRKKKCTFVHSKFQSPNVIPAGLTRWHLATGHGHHQPPMPSRTCKGKAASSARGCSGSPWRKRAFYKKPRFFSLQKPRAESSCPPRLKRHCRHRRKKERLRLKSRRRSTGANRKSSSCFSFPFATRAGEGDYRDYRLQRNKNPTASHARVATAALKGPPGNTSYLFFPSSGCTFNC